VAFWGTVVRGKLKSMENMPIFIAVILLIEAALFLFFCDSAYYKGYREDKRNQG
jgi:hypothetical protein